MASLVEAQDERADAVEDLETAVDAVGVLATTLSTAATVFNGTTAVELEIYSADAATLVAAARNELASERQTTSDQALRDAVATEQRAINGDTVKKFDAAGAVGTDFTARDLQVRAESAQAAANAHVSNNGSDLALASALDNAIGRYLNAASDVGTGELRDVQVAYNAVLAALEADPVDPAAVGVALTAWTSSIDDALEAVFGVDSSAPDYRSDVDAGNSTLNENVAAAAGLEQALLLANQRFALQEDAVAKEAAFGGTGMVGEDLRAAQDELQGRNELIKLLADARDAEAAVNGSIEDFQAAEAKLAEAAETLGYEVEALDNGFEYGTDAADLFLFGEATPTTVILSDFAADDALYLGGKVVQGNLGSADNNQLEFFISSNAAGDAVVQIENSVFGSVSENFTEITLTGVSVDSLNVDGGLITVVDVA